MPISNNIFKIKILLGTLIVILTFHSCKEKTEDCLDTLATNFEVAAEENCCCTYPTLSWSIGHKFLSTDINFLNDSLYQYTNGDVLFFDTLLFYLSDIKLIETDGTVIEAEESSSYTIWDGTDSTSQIFSDAWGLFSPEQFSLNCGTYRLTKNTSDLRFTFGISPERASIKYNSLSSSYQDEEDRMQKVDGIYGIYLKYSYNGIERTIQSNIYETVNLSLNGQLTEGSNTTLSVFIDYGLLFQGIDWANDTDADIETKINANILSAFQ